MGVDILHAINSFHGNCYRKRVILSAGDDIIALGNSVATKDRVSRQLEWCCSNGIGVAGMVLQQRGIVLQQRKWCCSNENGVAATGNGVGATGNGVAATGNGVAATGRMVLQQPIYSQFCKMITLVPN